MSFNFKKFYIKFVYWQDKTRQVNYIVFIIFYFIYKRNTNVFHHYFLLLLQFESMKVLYTVNKWHNRIMNWNKNIKIKLHVLNCFLQLLIWWQGINKLNVWIFYNKSSNKYFLRMIQLGWFDVFMNTVPYLQPIRIKLFF